MPNTNPATTTPLCIEDDELATILAALRFYQESGQAEPRNRAPGIDAIATSDGDLAPLDADAIDALCEKLHGADWSESCGLALGGPSSVVAFPS